MPSNPMNALNNASATMNAESELTYVPPEGPRYEDQAEFDQSLKDIVSEIEGEFHDDEAPEFTDEELAQPDDLQETKPEVEDGASEAVDEKEDQGVARGMERLVAREVALQAKEQAFQARESQLSRLEQELTTLRKAAPSQKIIEDFDYSPTKAVTALGKDPKTVVRLMIAEQLEAEGKPVPDELKEHLRDAKYSRELTSLRRELAEKTRAEQQYAEYSAVVLGAKEHAKTLVGSKDAPTLAELSAIDTDLAHQEIMEEIQKDARARMATDPDGQPITFQEATKRAEARLARLKGILKGQPNGTVTPASTLESKKPVGAANKVSPPQQKPPVRPLKPWEKKDDDLYKRGIDEAVREYHLSEARAKGRR